MFCYAAWIYASVGDAFILTQLMTCTNRLNNFSYPFP